MAAEPGLAEIAAGWLCTLTAAAGWIWLCWRWGRYPDPEVHEGVAVAAQIRPGRCRNHLTPSALCARHPDDLEPGDYWLTRRGLWLLCDPDGRLFPLPPSEATGHRDGSLSAEPSGSRWRLTRGRWYTEAPEPEDGEDGGEAA